MRAAALGLALAIALFAPDRATAEQCTFVSAAFVFGATDPQLLNQRCGQGTIVLKCPKGTMVELDGGSSGNVLDRQMRGTRWGDVLRYNLYLDPQCTSVWGEGTRAGPRPESVIRDKQNMIVYVFGQIAPDQFVTADDYTDTVRITILP